jgi:hypothetical protein
MAPTTCRELMPTGRNERQVRPRRADDRTRITLVALSSLIEWRHILTIVKPDTLIGSVRERHVRVCVLLGIALAAAGTREGAPAGPAEDWMRVAAHRGRGRSDSLLSHGTACYDRSCETVAGHDRTTVASIIAGRETRRSVIDASCTVIRGRS